MKAIVAPVVIAVLCVASARAAEQTLTGTVSDSLCGASHKDMGTRR